MKHTDAGFTNIINLEENVSVVVKRDIVVGQEDSMELPLLDLATIVNATNNFSTDNKLGQGGFGPVYKVNDTIPYASFIEMNYW